MLYKSRFMSFIDWAFDGVLRDIVLVFNKVFVTGAASWVTWKCLEISRGGLD